MHGMARASLAAEPATWVIGDVHGCRRSLDALLAHPEIGRDPRCRLWFTGDLVNRGPASARTLRRVMALGDRATVVLGNHDMRALAVAAGCARLRPRDTLQDLMVAPDAPALLDWLRHRPLLHAWHGHALVHAGIFPGWDLSTAAALAEEAQACLRHERWRERMRKLWGRSPQAWSPQLRGASRLRFIVNALTRMRLCTREGGMVLGARAVPRRWRGGMLPWFDLPGRIAGEATVLFGHWAGLGLLVREDAVCLDTACVGGGVLTALRLQDRKLVQVPCEDAMQAQAAQVPPLPGAVSASGAAPAMQRSPPAPSCR